MGKLKACLFDNLDIPCGEHQSSLLGMLLSHFSQS